MAEITPGLRLTLFLHYLCPYGQRTLYAAAYKGLHVDVVEVNLEHKADWHLAMNPAGTSPTLKVEKEGKNFILTESLQIMEFFNSFSGPNLYPLGQNGLVCPLMKAIVDSHGKVLADQLGPSLAPFYSRIPTPEEIKKAKAALGKINGYLQGGSFLLHRPLGQDMLTMADLALLPFIERAFNFRSSLFSSVFEGEDYTRLLEWFETVSAMPWSVGPRADPKKLANVYRMMREGTYHGLSLPISKYD